MKHQDRQIKFRQLLLSRSSVTAREGMLELGISQATFARLVSSMSSEVLIMGTGRSSRYALKRELEFLPPSSRFQKLPISAVLESGEILHLADLHAVGQRSFYLESFSPDVRSLMYSDIPYWLNDLRPSGFLGRLIPKRHPELGYPEDIRFWNADCAIAYWTTLGWDLIGNLIVGEHAYELLTKYQTSPPSIVSDSNRAGTYSKLADEVIALGAAGSSAAGEQPKFLTVKSDGKQSVLVKFSPTGDDPVSKRRKDLLICEHLALEVIRECEVPASKSEIIVATERIFLELERFDRVGAKGRRGLITLESLDLEFTGRGGTWREISMSLKDAKIISADLYKEILWRYYFGVCIGNTDMHAGNLSFFIQGEKILSLAPVYDMLPMTYAPVHEEVTKPKFQAPLLPPYDKNIWQKVIKPAGIFWGSVQQDLRIGSEIREVAREWLEFLSHL